MKSYIKILGICCLLLGAVACKKGPSCPAYDSVHNSKNNPYNPNNPKRTAENNKKEIEKQKKAELEGNDEKSLKKKRKEAYSLFPKGMR